MKNYNVAIIPAREGSKGIKGKNFKKINNKPLITWTIEFLKKLKFINLIIISSDSLKIKKIVKTDKKVIFLKRPKKISSDDSPTEDCIIHVLKNFKEIKIDNIFLFEPTSPLRKLSTVKDCYKTYLTKKLDSLFTVSASNKLFGRISNHKFEKINKNEKTRRQDRKSIYYETGVVYIFKPLLFLKEKKIVTKKSYPFVVEEIEGFDINTLTDFKIVECMMKKF
ncbi:MAG: hypothetical protein CBB97_12620 [Candidatus Endolissoclinum sp. TMED37]|nr:MAG: hypothetical protein CBB97_12620 [Candidatus Endolissoclinum sp. TMED37]